jgi:Legionella pneumophila major outer membrane protein precursor.
MKVPSTFVGAGPRLGLDFSYDAYKGFQLTGEAAASLLMGTLKNHTRYESLSPYLATLGIDPLNEQSISADNKMQLIPSFGGRLGVAYCVTFCNSCTIKVEAGYEARVYINAIQSVDISSVAISSPVLIDNVGVFARTFDRTLSNFGLAGPYLALKIGF